MFPCWPPGTHEPSLLLMEKVRSSETKWTAGRRSLTRRLFVFATFGGLFGKSDDASVSSRARPVLFVRQSLSIHLEDNDLEMPAEV